MGVNRISVIGLGLMGYKIAELYAKAGYDLTVWNRTKSRADGLKAKVAESLSDAVLASDTIIICVLNPDAVHAALDTVKDKSIFKNKTVINYTAAGPEDVDKIEEVLKSYGAHYLNGVILVSPDHLAQPDTTFLYSGDEDAFKALKDAFEVTAGNIKFLSTKASVSSTLDLATLSVFYGAYIGVLNGIALSEAAGVSLEVYGDIFSAALPGFTALYKDYVIAIQNDDFTPVQTSVSGNLIATQRIADALAAIGADSGFAQTIAGLVKKADKKGYGDEELASVIKVIRSK